MAGFLVFLPALLLSGFMFPVSSMPEGFQLAHPAQSAAPLPGDRARPLPQRIGDRRPLASARGPAGDGDVAALAGGAAVPGGVRGAPSSGAATSSTLGYRTGR